MAYQYVKLFTVLSLEKIFALLIVKLIQALILTSLNSQIKTVLSTHLVSEIRLSCQKTVQRSQEVKNLYFEETIEILCIVLSTYSLSTLNKFSSS